MKSHLSLNPMAKWALATNPVDVQFRTVLEQTIKDKHIENKKSYRLLAKHYPSGTITDIIEEHMSNNKTSLDESIKMIVDDILNNECQQVQWDNPKIKTKMDNLITNISCPFAMCRKIQLEMLFKVIFMWT